MLTMPVYIEIPVTILVLAAVAFLFGLLLAVAAKKFAVEKDPRIDAIAENLAGANCGGCGYSGCGAYAKAIVDGEAETGLCPVAGKEANRKIAEIMGQADMTKFSDNTDTGKLRKILDFTIEGLMTERFREQAFDVEKLMDEVKDYLAMLKKLTYQ